MSAKTYASFETEHRRLAILKLLAGDAGYSANDSVIRSAVATLGFAASRDRIRADLRWLEEQELLTVDEVGALLVGKINQRGVDVSEGVARVDGVQRPSPGA